ncbi:hypothetical protein A4H97_13825 [Niastella yeongjuensis]|uniref:DUF2652 domain-containing protein n=1 Tax=Niastella yeongjuensis TaxID=354355 RepID=A0A1V9E3L4_9BACT|nr:DUF2652 domain-containing protein [Niastella yeongjuensis]OQP40698.1 hypothetical protein A4H97_13825 [Niastella yeongjuensis]SEP04284.1 Protein of unknown function [Niastella yeongjuensis]
MDNRGLLFIPDISGFTRFVSETEIEHSRYIIQELLEVLIKSNRLGLQISEIEGDAILFYKFGEAPALPELYKQVEDMFCAFHRCLIAYDRRKYCQCAACTAAVELTLKVITHYGEFTGYQVQQFNKLIGKDVIVAHQLLKNDISQHEYWLVTNNLVAGKEPEDITQWMHWEISNKETETGVIPYHYTLLSELKERLPAEPLEPVVFTDKVKILSLSKEYNTDIITLFHATGDFSFRSSWQEGIVKVEDIDHHLPRIGMRCRVYTEKGDRYVYSSSYYYQPDKIRFSETDEKNGDTTYFTLEKINDTTSRLTLDLYRKRNFITQLLSVLAGRNKLKGSYERSMVNLATLLKNKSF